MANQQSRVQKLLFQNCSTEKPNGLPATGINAGLILKSLMNKEVKTINMETLTKTKSKAPLNGTATKDYKGEWYFRLNINNQTDRELTFQSSNLSWGIWYTGGVDGAIPVSVPPRTVTEALGIRANSGTADGYMCSCVWKDSKVGSGNFGTIILNLDVPFTANNSSSCVATGLYEISGWESLPQKGHTFPCTITITEVGSNLNATSLDFTKEITASENTRFFEYEKEVTNANDLMTNWDKLEQVKIQNHFNPADFLPETYTYPPVPMMICRTEKHPISKKLWQGIGDPIYQTPYAQETYVDEYFSVAVYFVNTNPRSTQSISAGTEEATESTIEVTSAIKNTLSTAFTLRSLLKTESTIPQIGSVITAEIETTYSQSNVLEESNSTFERNTKTIKIAPSAKDRMFVQWVFSTAIAIYRKTKSGKVSLIAVSEWSDEAMNKTYEY